MQWIGGRGLGCQCIVKFRNLFLGDLPLLEAGSLLRGSMVPLPSAYATICCPEVSSFNLSFSWSQCL